MYIMCIYECNIYVYDTYKHPYSRLTACVLRSHITFTGVFPLHAWTVTRNLSTYFTSMGRVLVVSGAL